MTRRVSTKTNRKVWVSVVDINWSNNPKRNPRGPLPKFHIRQLVVNSGSPSWRWVKDLVENHLDRRVDLFISGSYPADPKKFLDYQGKLVTRGYRSSDAHMIVSGIWQDTKPFMYHSKAAGSNEVLMWTSVRSGKENK